MVNKKIKQCKAKKSLPKYPIRTWKKCSISIARRRAQVKVTVKYHDTSARKAKNFFNNTIGQRGWETTGTLIHCCLEQLFWKIDWQYLLKWNMQNPYDSAILHIYLKEMSTHVYSKTQIRIVIALLRIVPPN